MERGGKEGVETEKRANPLPTSKILKAEHVRGPYASSRTPRRRGAVKLMEVAMTKSRWTAPRLRAGPPSSLDAMRRELEMAAHPKISPPQARFWKQAARIMATRGALGFVMVSVLDGWMKRRVGIEDRKNG